ncbi:16S rRNA (guanine(966)-N(2))-methyltransferase RsmD [Buchnera aphidicola]|uniref:16S rRNA (guanine(966)-N(2))-methyltransferase RsmD n=1 Tax=Buchnera aphidicola TaxID=9 RepID=UPI0031B6AAB7
MKKKKQHKKNIKIIGGKFRGRYLNSVKHIKIQPTNSRTKETLFNWLQKFIKNSICLDCFSGSGNLSIESASRNSLFITALEKNKKLFKIIQKTISKFKIKNIHLHCTNTLTWLKKKGHPYDIIFLDPPFKKRHILQITIFLINQNDWIKKNSLIYIEKSKNFTTLIIPKNWICIKYHYTRRISYSLYQVSYTKKK